MYPKYGKRLFDVALALALALPALLLCLIFIVIIRVRSTSILKTIYFRINTFEMSIKNS